MRGSYGVIGQVAVPLVIAGVGIYAINKLLKSTEGGGEQSMEAQEDTVSKIKKEIKKENLSYPESWYLQKADYLQENLTKTWKAWEPASDCTKIITGLKKQDDWKQLVAVFGIRKPRAWSNTYKGGNLQSWLRYFLEEVYLRNKDGSTTKGSNVRYVDVVNTFLVTRLKVSPV